MHDNSVEPDRAQFDPIRGTLVIGEEWLGQLVELIERGSDSTGWPEPWSEDGLVTGGQLHPIVEGIGRVTANAMRSIAIERVAGGMAAPLAVAWDGSGRATMSEAIDDGRLAMRLTSFDLLPSLLMHELGLLRALDSSESGRSSMVVPAADVEALLDPDVTEPRRPDAGHTDSQTPVVADTYAAWRAVGGWAGQQADSALIGLVAESGLWQIQPDGNDTVRLSPATVTSLAAKLGVVVTGRKADRPSSPDSPKANTGNTANKATVEPFAPINDAAVS